MSECFECARAAVLVKLRVDELDLFDAFAFAERLDLATPFIGLRFGWIDDERVMDLVVFPLFKYLGDMLATQMADKEEHGDTNRYDRDDDCDNNNRYRHLGRLHRFHSYLFRWDVHGQISRI